MQYFEGTLTLLKLDKNKLISHGRWFITFVGYSSVGMRR